MGIAQTVGTVLASGAGLYLLLCLMEAGAQWAFGRALRKTT